MYVHMHKRGEVFFKWNFYFNIFFIITYIYRHVQVPTMQK